MHTLSQTAGPPIDVVTGDKVWMPADALAQLERAAALPGCVAAAAMPDLHAGPGLPIGAALAFSEVVYPGLVGSDIGCGATLIVIRERRAGMDALERRLTAQFAEETLPWHAEAGLLSALAATGPRALQDSPAIPALVRWLGGQVQPAEPLDVGESGLGDLTSDLWLQALGTIGGGNHFAEVVQIGKVAMGHDEALRIKPREIAVLVHSGSRGLGKLIADHFGHGPLCGEGLQRYLVAHDWACRFAHANRMLLAWRLLAALGAARPDKVSLAVDCTHNQVVPWILDGRPVWLHRKGAAPAAADEPTLVLGSRGAPSWLLLGRGSERGLASVAHGAGRRLSRADAFSRFKAKYTRESLRRTALGSRVLCDRTELLYEEHPEAYKPIEPVIDAIAAGGLATPVAELVPLITVKQ